MVIFIKKQLQSAFHARQYMLSGDFEIYYYNDFPSGTITAHKHDNYEFYFFLEGNIEISIHQEVYPLKPGDFLVFPPDLSHRPIILNKNKPYRRFVLWIAKEYLNQLVTQSTDYAYLIQHAVTHKKYLYSTEPITFNSIQSAIFRLIEETKSSRFGKEAELKLQVNSLLLLLSRTVYEANTGASRNAEKTLYLDICNFISVHLEEDLSLDRLANEFYVSKFYISHAFKDNMGISIHQYITKKRLHACKDALLSSETVGSIFEQYGFHDYSSFYRAFKKEYGISPRDYKGKYLLPN